MSFSVKFTAEETAQWAKEHFGEEVAMKLRGMCQQ